MAFAYKAASTERRRWRRTATIRWRESIGGVGLLTAADRYPATTPGAEFAPSPQAGSLFSSDLLADAAG
jgi:hypothetical protein